MQLSVPGDTIVINNTMGVARGPPRYERIPPSQGEYQEPTRPQPSLPPAPPGPGEWRREEGMGGWRPHGDGWWDRWMGGWEKGWRRTV